MIFKKNNNNIMRTWVQLPAGFQFLFPTNLTFLLGLGAMCGLAPDRRRASVDVSMVTGSSWVSIDPVESALTLARGTSSSLVGLVASLWSLAVDARLKGF